MLKNRSDVEKSYCNCFPFQFSREVGIGDCGDKTVCQANPTHTVTHPEKHHKQTRNKCGNKRYKKYRKKRRKKKEEIHGKYRTVCQANLTCTDTQGEKPQTRDDKENQLLHERNTVFLNVILECL